MLMVENEQPIQDQSQNITSGDISVQTEIPDINPSDIQPLANESNAKKSNPLRILILGLAFFVLGSIGLALSSAFNAAEPGIFIIVGLVLTIKGVKRGLNDEDDKVRNGTIFILTLSFLILIFAGVMKAYVGSSKASCTSESGRCGTSSN